MGRTPSCGKLGHKRGPWTPEEDLCLTNHVKAHGEGHWRFLSKKAGLLRSGKSCRMRWLNYLQPDVKRGRILPDEEDLILRLHRLLGNRWSLIAGRLPGRTDNDVKNYWNSHLSKKLISQGIDPRTHRPLSESEDIWWNPEDSDIQEKIRRYTTSQESVNPEIRDKDSDLIIAGHKEDQICSSVATPGISSLQTILSSTSEIVGYGEVSKSNCCETPKQEPYSIRFPYSFPATPIAYENTSYIRPSFLQSLINEDFEMPEDNSASKLFPHQSDLASPNYELWSSSMHYHPPR